MVTQEEIDFYNEKGYLVVPNLVPMPELTIMRAELEKLVNESALVTENNQIYDLQEAHSSTKPGVRRIKEPQKYMPSVAALMRQPALVSILTQLLGTGVRFQNAKLNMKSAGYGAAVEWHQDCSFYPHTNDDLLAVGIMLDDVDDMNGPMQVIPGSHRGEICDHHADGFFCGAIDPTRKEFDMNSAVALTGTAGSVTFHHVRTIHGSALNRSDRSRNFLLFQFTANDAWPLAQRVKDLAEYDALIVAGEPTLIPRLESIPVRLPLPPAPMQGSIYENQKTLKNRFFDTYEGQSAT